MNTQNRVYVFCLLGLLLITAPYILVRSGLRLYNNNGSVEKIMQHDIDAEIAIFGSSVAWVHFNPMIIEEITGRTSYNFGLNGTNLSQYQGALKEYISYSDSKIIVLAGTFVDFQQRKSIQDIYKYYDWLENSFLYESFTGIDPQLAFRARYIPLYSLATFNQDIYKRSIKGYLGKTYVKEYNEYKGFSAKDLPWRAAPSDSSVLANINNKVVADYKNIIKMANYKGKKVIIVLPPIYTEGQDKIANLNQLRTLCNSLATGNNFFMDFTESNICENKELFYNYTHLNAKGADLFSKEFSQKLLSIL